MKLENINESIDNTITNQFEVYSSKTVKDLDIISFTLDFISLNSGFGFKIQTKFIQNIYQKMLIMKCIL